MDKQDITDVKMGGAKRKNGHKLSCTCHICENIKNKAKRGGYEEDAEKEKLRRMGGSKKKNGHKPNCNCPICKNMRNANKKSKKKHTYKGGDEEMDTEIIIDENDNNDEIKDDIELQSAGRKKRKTRRRHYRVSHKGGDEQSTTDIDVTINEDKKLNEEPASEEDYDKIENTMGGSRKNRGSRKSNGHKMNCKCPICKNMKRSRRNKRN